ncbi:MAG: BatD family protein [bacterium]|nr:BatD family protein [bacterium]
MIDRRTGRRGGWARRYAAGFGLLQFALVASGGAFAQEAQVQVGRGPHYVGDPINLQVVAFDFEEDPTPEIDAPALEDGTLRFAGVSPSVSSSISIVNGRMSRSKEVRFVYQYELIANRTGRIDLPPFRVRQGATTRSTGPTRLDVKGVPTTGMVGLSVSLPEGPIFVGQKVPVAIELRIDREAERDLIEYSATVPLFDVPNLRFLDAPGSSQSTLEIETAEGRLRLPAALREETVGGRTVLVLRAERTMIALSPEPLRAAPPRIVISRGTRFRRDVFGQRQATSSERLMSEGRPVDLEVIEVPRIGRPPTWAGAVGSGYTLEVSADRSVVQLGEPIVLSFVLRGDGDLSSAGLPPFDAPGFFDPARFRLPEEPPAGLVDEDGKRFEVSLRVLDANVREVPALEYAWFDAKTRRFETTTTRPIALSVGAAQVIGADDVDRGAGALVTSSASGEADGDPAGTPSSPERRDSFAASGANLAIELQPARVLDGGRRVAGAGVEVPAIYALSVALLGFAVLDARRRRRDPAERARAGAIVAARREIEGATEAGALGRALREFAAAMPEAAAGEHDALLAECDALRFAPGGEQAELPASLKARALRFLDTLESGKGA